MKTSDPTRHPVQAPAEPSQSDSDPAAPTSSTGQLQRRFRLGRWRVDTEEGSLRHGDELRKLPAQPMQLLVFLASHAGEVLSRDSLLEAIWPGIAVTESSLTRCVSELRTALDDDPRQPRYIETLPKRGYRLVATVERAVADADLPGPADGPWVASQTRPPHPDPPPKAGRRVGWAVPALAFTLVLLGWGLLTLFDRGLGTRRPLSPADALPADPAARALYQGGLEALRLLDLPQAAEQLRRAAEIEGGSPLGQRALAEALFLAGRIDAAQIAAQHAVELGDALPRTSQVWIEGWQATTQLDWPRAEEAFRALTVLEPGNSAAALGLATVLLESGQYGETLTEIDLSRDRVDPLGQDPRFDELVHRATLFTSDFDRSLASADKLLAHAAADGAAGLEIRARAGRGQALLHRGEKDAGLAELEQALQLATDQQDLSAQAEILRYQGVHCLRLGQYPESEEASAGALAIARATGLPRLEAGALTSLARITQATGESERAAEYFDQANALAQALGDLAQQRHLLTDMAIFHATTLYDLPRALELFEQALELARQQGADRSVADGLINLGTLNTTLGRTDIAGGYFEEAASIYRRTGNREGLARARLSQGGHFLDQGQINLASDALRESVAQFRAVDNERMIAAALVRRGEVEAAQGRFADARRTHEEALALRIRLGSLPRIQISQLELALLALRECDPRRAAIEAAAIEQEAEPGGGFWRHARRVLLRAILAQAQPQEALRLLRQRPEDPEGDAAECCFWSLAEIETKLQLGELAAAEEQARTVSRELSETGEWSAWAQVQLLLARIESHSGRTDQAHQRLQSLHDDAEKRGWTLLAHRAQTLLQLDAPGLAEACRPVQ
ncbi:MAG: winged helix-turn-helix domain-containing protein [Acidobacteriota bacterium]